MRNYSSLKNPGNSGDITMYIRALIVILFCLINQNAIHLEIAATRHDEFYCGFYYHDPIKRELAYTVTVYVNNDTFYLKGAVSLSAA